MLDAPTKGFGAFMPAPYAVTTPAASSQGPLTARLEGYPGNRPIPSPAPAAMNDGELGGPFNQPSNVSPDVFYPALYFNHIDQTIVMPGFVRTCANTVPVPAPYVGRTGTQTQLRSRVGGRTATAWPRAFVRWPTYRTVRS